MRTIGKALGVLIVLAIIGAGVLWLDPSLRTPAWVQAQVVGLNTGVLPVDRADWGFLKLRSGPAGLDALETLERHSPRTEVRRVAAAVDGQWYEKGHEFPCSFVCEDDGPLDHETRFSELRLPLDGMTLPRDLLPGQAIPQDFWDDQRFHLGCPMPPKKWTRSETCTLRMADLTGDGHPEIIIDSRIDGLEDIYVRSVLHQGWTVYRQDKAGWTAAAHIRFREVDDAASPDAAPHVMTAPLDILWLDGHAVNFFCGRCSGSRLPTAGAGMAAAAAMAPRLGQVPRLYGGPVPDSLIKALAARKILPSRFDGLAARDASFIMPTTVTNPPACFVSADPSACWIIVADIDHDGRDDVMVLDRKPVYENPDLRMATLMMQRGGGWQVVANRTICAGKGEPSVAFRPSPWRPVEFDGRLYTPDDDDQTCQVPFLMM